MNEILTTGGGKNDATVKWFAPQKEINCEKGTERKAQDRLKGVGDGIAWMNARRENEERRKIQSWKDSHTAQRHSYTAEKLFVMLCWCYSPLPHGIIVIEAEAEATGGKLFKHVY